MVAGREDHLGHAGVDRRTQDVVGTDNVDLKDIVKGRLGADAAQVQHGVDLAAGLGHGFRIEDVEVHHLLAVLDVVDVGHVGQAQHPIFAAQEGAEKPSHIAGGAGDQ